MSHKHRFVAVTVHYPEDIGNIVKKQNATKCKYIKLSEQREKAKCNKKLDILFPDYMRKSSVITSK